MTPVGPSGTVADYAIRATSRHDVATTLVRARAALADEGFGVLCEIDVHATLQARLGVARDPDTILGACNPALAHTALDAEPDLGVLLPCNVVVYEHNGAVVVAAVSAEHLLGIVGNAELAPVARAVGERLARVVAVASGD